MAFNVQRGLQNMFSGLEEDWQKRIDDQAEFERQEKIAQSKMLKQREQYNWEKAQQLESRDAEMTRLKAEGEAMGYTGPDLARYVNSGGSTIPKTAEELDADLERDVTRVKREAEIKNEVFEANLQNLNLSEEDKIKARRARIGIQTTDFQRKQKFIDDIIEGAEVGPDGEPVFSQVDIMKLSAAGIDLNKRGGLSAKDLLGARETASKNTSAYFKENPITAEQIDAAKAEIVSQKQAAGEDVTNYKPSDTEANNYLWNQHFDGEVGRITGTTPATGSGAGAPPPPTGGAGGGTIERPNANDPYLGLIEPPPMTGGLRQGVRPQSADNISRTIDNLPEGDQLRMAAGVAPANLKDKASQDPVLAKRILYQAVKSNRMDIKDLKAQPTALRTPEQEGFTNVPPTDPTFQQGRVDQLISTGRVDTRQ